MYDTEYVKVGFCEDFEIDVIEWYDEIFSEVKDVTFFEDLILLMDEYFDTSIKKYDVTELMGHGVGFAFFT